MNSATSHIWSQDHRRNRLPGEIFLHSIEGIQMKLGHLALFAATGGVVLPALLGCGPLEGASPAFIFGLIAFWLRDGICILHRYINLDSGSKGSEREFAHESRIMRRWKPMNQQSQAWLQTWSRANAVGYCPTLSRFRPRLATISSLIHEHGN